MTNAIAWMAQQPSSLTRRTGRPLKYDAHIYDDVRRLLTTTSMTQKKIAEAVGVGRHLIADLIQRERIERKPARHPGTNQFSKERK